MPQNKLWTVGSCLSWTRDYLDRKGDDHARLSAEWLLCAATDKDRTRLYMDYDQPLSPDELSLMHGYIERRAAGEPLQYITGRTTFRFVEVACEPGVLIPRPETEILVDAALEGVDACPDDEPLVLEVGTGTGCVAASIASERKAARVVATDLSPVAAGLARRNVASLGLDGRVDVVECDLAAGVDESLMGRFAVLVSNPPYIPTAVLEAEVPAEVRDNEPDLALDGGADGLDVYHRLLELAPRALRPGGMLCVELFEGALDPAALLARGQGVWDTVEVREDLTHRPRILVARLPRE
ncbi:peptide chain release factor N(5)-glutamine methyltransferase [Atopobiaceae bacterium Sow4_H2]